MQSPSGSKRKASDKDESVFAREYWTGDSRDGALVNGDGYHFYRMTPDGRIQEAYEYYENDDGSEVASALPEMKNVHWLEDLGFEDWEALEKISEAEFDRVKGLTAFKKK